MRPVMRSAALFALSTLPLLADVTGRWKAGGAKYSSCARLANPSPVKYKDAAANRHSRLSMAKFAATSSSRCGQ